MQRALRDGILIGLLVSAAHAADQGVLSEKLTSYVETFNKADAELYPQHVPNAQAAEFLRANIPLFECPDPEIERTYYFRWWTYRKHIRQTPDGFVMTEFLPPVGWASKHNTISCAAGHHLYEGRWLKDARFLDDYTVFWLRKGTGLHRYSHWLADAIWARHLVQGRPALPKDLLPDLVQNFRQWAKERRDPNGLFWQEDGADGMEVAIGGTGYRATINSYMFADARAIASLARLAGQDRLAIEFEEEAARIKRLVQDKLWDPEAQFFKMRKRQPEPGDPEQPLADVRELYGFTPWYFNLPDPQFAGAWRQLMHPQGFYAPFGPTTAEQRHPKFAVVYRGHECQWNGPSWPYSTAVTLTALANLLHNDPQQAITKRDYFDILKCYTRSHVLREKRLEVLGRLEAAPGAAAPQTPICTPEAVPAPDAASLNSLDKQPWIDENLNPYTGDWIARSLLRERKQKPEERGKDYNHSTYCDLIITGLIGLRPRPDDAVEVRPLAPDDWDYFCLDQVAYHGRRLTILWDKTGRRYGRGQGLRVLAEGKEIASAPTLARVSGTLPPEKSGSAPTEDPAAAWIKSPANPVLGGNLGTCFDVALLKESDTFRMWFSWRPRKCVALVESRDGMHWSEPLVVLGPNPASGWEDDVNRPAVIRRSDGYHMWFTGQAKGRSRIGYATSPDGKTWKRMRDTPVLAPETPWEKVAVMCPHVIWNDDTRQFRMWYSGGEQHEPNAIGYATSPDGLAWTKWPSNPVFAANPGCEWEQHKVTACQVLRHGDWHVMFYIGFRDEDHAQIGLARSRDGIGQWERHPANPILGLSASVWDADACYKPFAILDGPRWLLWYNGRHGGTEQIGLAVHEGEDLGFGSGFPSRDPNLDALPGFQEPPPGYGEVPFWWWTGDPLDKDRLLWQIDQLHKKGISGMQVNYAHEDTPGWPTYAAQPDLFSDPWWDAWEFAAGQCAQRGMGIGLSGYTLDWPNTKSLISRTIYSEPEIQGREIDVPRKHRLGAGQTLASALPADTVAVRAYPLKTGEFGPGSLDLSSQVRDQRLEWAPAGGDWEVWIFTAPRKPGTLNPIHPLAGRRVIEKFFQPFQDHAPGRSSAGLNYFFHDELQFGVGDRVWADDLSREFEQAKGYGLFEALPAMFQDVGPKTAKYRLDFMDVKVRLAQQRYFIPIFQWHQNRGKIYGCDQGSRGRDPLEFGDYFSAVRWYTAPGHDTPGGQADLIKGKVSSSIAHLYRRPRVWLEGYHSLGWGATPENLMFATRENYLYGCTLLNLHGLYYTTHGSFWEWAPPCYHFRMPYWEHMGVFLKYFERLSYLMSQGVHQCDIAILYPVAPAQAGLGGPEATHAAFAAGTTLMNRGFDFIFIDFESLARATIGDGRLHVADASYRLLVLPAMRAVRWSTLEKAREFFRAGGIVIAGGALPEASDRAGRDDPQLDAIAKELFGATARETAAGTRPPVQRNNAGGVGIALLPGDKPRTEEVWASLPARIESLVPREVQAAHPIKATHRRVGPRDVYMVMGAPRNSAVEFRAKGRVELWDPWTGNAQPLRVLDETATGTRVELPLEDYEAQIVVFTPGQPHVNPPRLQHRLVQEITLDHDWEFELKPTMDNRFGDFRLPATDRMIGPEARIFRHAVETGDPAAWREPAFDDSRWSRVTFDFGPQFWVLGPVPGGPGADALEARLAGLARIDPDETVSLEGNSFPWRPYSFSWRLGFEGDPGHQGWHGLKENVTDHFLCLGKRADALNEFKYEPELAGGRYYLWTSATVDRPTPVRIAASAPRDGSKPHASEVLTPAAVFLNGARAADLQKPVSLRAGANPILVRYDGAGRGYFVVKRDEESSRISTRTPLAMTWFDDPSVIRFDVHAGARPAEWFRFKAPPGLLAMTVNARGAVEAWADGQPMRAAAQGRFEVSRGIPGPAIVALRVRPEIGVGGGAVFPEPIRLECGAGVAALGDWSKAGVLECYSGGAWYRKAVTLTPEQAGGEVMLNLGKVVATAEVRVNGRTAGVRVAPPWRVDISNQVKPGENRIEVLVFNTLANHFLTVPTRYRGQPTAGLLGPVTLEMSTSAAAPAVTVGPVRRVFHNREHNAFTDLCRFRGQLFLAFRSCPDGHMVHPTASIVVLRSNDEGKTWEQVDRFAVQHRDTRDPHFLVFRDRLFVCTGTWYTGAKTIPREEYDLNKHLGFAAWSDDGIAWNPPVMLEGTFGHYVWRAAAFGDKAYLCARRKPGFDIAPRGEGDKIQSLMLESDDGFIWKKRAFFQEIAGDETAFLFQDDGSVLAVGRHGGGKNAHLLRAKPPYTNWERKPLDRSIGGPLIAKWGDRVVVGGRKTSNNSDPKTSLCWLLNDSLQEFAELPSGGDTSYPGFVQLSNDRALVSYYSSHERDATGKTITAIYLAELALTP